MNNQSQTVFVVDDEPMVRKALTLILARDGHRIQSFASSAEFLECWDGSVSGCLVSDVRMPGMDGMELLRNLFQRGRRIPVVMLSAHGDIPMAVEAVKIGAIDFLEKPADPDTLRQKVANALAVAVKWQQEDNEKEEVKDLLSTLTPREKEVIRLLADGKDAKIVAQILGSSYNTVRVQRASIMKKMKADNVADLVRMMNLISSEE